MMIIQVSYILVYIALDVVNDRHNLTPYQYFNLIITFWIMLFCFFFLHNSILRYLIEELKITLFTVSLLTICSTIRYTISAIHVFDDKLFEGDSTDAHFNRIIFFMDIVGIGINLMVLPMFSAVTYFVYVDMREFILFHLDGNRVMW